MITNLDVSSRQIFWGNILLIICCGFYLAWWLLAFKPVGAVSGMKSGWLLLPAFASGAAAVLLAVRGIEGAAVKTALFPGGRILWGGIALYIILAAVTALLLKRPITTELLLIVCWAVLALSEINVLCGSGGFSRGASLVYALVIGAAAAADLVCYVLYYNLSNRAGYLAGTVPLLLAAAVMAGIAAGMTIDAMK